MRASAIFVALSAAVASAQSPPTNYSSELDMTLDPNTLPSSEKGKPAVWCKAQTETCNTLCDKNTGKNSCNKEILKYDCTCASNNSAPGLQYYTQTMPTFICQEVFSQCNKANVGNADRQMDCTNKIQSKCGTLDPPKLSSGGGGGKGGSGSDDSSSSSTDASKPTSSQTSDRSAVTSSTSGGLAAPTMAPAGNGAAAAAAAIGFLAYLV